MSRTSAAMLAMAAAALVITTAPANAAVAHPSGGPTSANGNGQITYYNDAGYGACGTQINAANQLLVAVPASWWTTANPGNDPLCRESVKVTYQGRTITVPIRDKCAGCAANHIDLSQPAFSRLAGTSQGVLNGASWTVVSD